MAVLVLVLSSSPDAGTSEADVAGVEVDRVDRSSLVETGTAVVTSGIEMSKV